MGLTMQEKKSVTLAVARRYRKARKKEKGSMLDEFVATTGYNRDYASWVLSNWGREISRRLKNGDKLILVKDPELKRTRKKPRTYDQEVFPVIKQIWKILNRPCGKRLAPFLPEMVACLERHRELTLSPSLKKKVLGVSAATVDRLLKEEKKRWLLKGKSTTKPGTLLKSQIPIRTFADWNEQAPGFIEVDLVGHDGGYLDSFYNQTLTATDVFTGWTETEAIRNKARVWAFQGLKQVRERFPFPIRGIDSDNGGEFINHHLLEYCCSNRITFTRSRSYRKNDNCYVEQKNYAVVRKIVGYGRHDTEEELALLNQLYRPLSLYTNFFQPLRKLVKKEREGAKVKKYYDTPRTPYRRVMEASGIAASKKAELTELYHSLNPVQLKREIEKFQDKLTDVLVAKKRLRKEEKEVQKKEDFVYNLNEASVSHFV